jgi:hypothetical protein
MRAAARGSSVRGIREMRNGHSLGRIIFAVVLAEFRRAIGRGRTLRRPEIREEPPRGNSAR